MKSIKIIYREKDNDVLELRLGNGTIHEFKSKRTYTAYLNKTNKFLTDQLHTLNYIYAEVHTLYRMNWGYFRHDKNSMSFKKYQSERDIKTAIESINKSFEQVVTVSTHEQGNYYSFIILAKIVYSLKEIIKTLSHLAKTQSNTVNVNKCKYHINQVLTVENELNNYGQLEATGYFNKLYDLELIENEYKQDLRII